PGGTKGGDDAGDRAEPDREDDGDDHQAPRDQEEAEVRCRRRRIDEAGDSPAEEQSDAATDRADQGRLQQVFAQDVTGVGSNRFLEPDLPDALGDRHQHGVDDRQATHDQRQERGSGGDRREQGAAGLEAIDDRAGLGRLDAADLVVDAVGQIVQIDARLAVDGHAGDQRAGVDPVPNGGWQTVLEQHLGVREVDERARARADLGVGQYHDNSEVVVDEVRLRIARPDPQVDGAA